MTATGCGRPRVHTIRCQCHVTVVSAIIGSGGEQRRAIERETGVHGIKIGPWPSRGGGNQDIFITGTIVNVRRVIDIVRDRMGKSVRILPDESVLRLPPCHHGGAPTNYHPGSLSDVRGRVGGGGGRTAFGRGDAVTREDRRGREGGDEGGDMGSGGVGDSSAGGAKRSRDPQQPPGESSRSWEPQSMRKEKHVRIDERGGRLMRFARIDTLPAYQVPGDRRLFINGLKVHTSEDALREYAQQFGEVTDATMCLNGQHFGFVTLKD